MRFHSGCLVVFGLLAIMGCAAYKPKPLTVEHPAHPEGMAAAERPLSKTLAYTPSDIPSARRISTVDTSQQGGHGGQHPSAASPSETVVGEGKVIAVVPNANQIVVDHEEIKGFMEAMTMGYRIDPPSLLEGLKSGDKIHFTIDVQKKAIIKIEKLKE